MEHVYDTATALRQCMASLMITDLRKRNTGLYSFPCAFDDLGYDTCMQTRAGGVVLPINSNCALWLLERGFVTEMGADWLIWTETEQ